MSELDGIDELFANVPGGEYMLQLLRNDPSVRAAIEGMDRDDPASVDRGLRAVLGALGLHGEQAESMLTMARQMMSDPARVAEAARAAGLDPSAVPGPHMAAQAAAAAAAEEAPAQPADTAPARDTPDYFAIAEQAQAHIDDGSERAALSALTDALDHPCVDEYDPRDDAWLGVTAVLEMCAAEVTAVGRQLPLRFRDAYQRLAWDSGVTAPAPNDNPAFTKWASGVVEQRSRPR